MRKLICTLVLTMIATLSTMFYAYGDNPVVQTIYTSDPAALVHEDRVYLYTGHDEDGATYYTMNEWMCYSSQDMVNWTDHGAVLHYKTFAWAQGDAWAAQCIERDGKFYFYVTVSRKGGTPVIGVAVADSPTGPFVDPIGKPLVQDGWGDIDPTVFIDDDGQAYMYWGNPQLKYVKLNKDMISTDGSVVHVPLTHEGFGVRKGNPERATLYEEGPWIYKRNGLYYLLYAASGIPENIAYSTSTSPIGPWTYQGIIMPSQGASFTNHPSVSDYKGKSYFFYHNGALSGGSGFARSVSIEEFKYNEDGTFPEINMTKDGPSAVGTINPYEKNEAETMAWSVGVETEPYTQGGMNVYDIHKGDYIKVASVDFGKAGPAMFTAFVSSEGQGGTIEVRLNSKDGELLGILPVGYTGGYDHWNKKSINVSATTGVHDIFFVFKGEGDKSLYKFESWEFVEQSKTRTLVGLSSTIDQYKIDIIEGNNQGTLQIFALYSDGTTENISSQANVSSEGDGSVTVNGNKVKGIAYGNVVMNIQYNGFSDVVHVHVKDNKTEKTVKSLVTDITELSIHAGVTSYFSVTAEYVDGHIEDVTKSATYKVEHPEVAAGANGVIRSLAVGTTNLQISFQGELGEPITTSIVITITEVNPYEQVEAEDFEEQSGVITEASSETAFNVCNIENGDWIQFGHVDFSRGAKEFLVRVSSATEGGTLEMYLDNMDGNPIATCKVDGTGGWQKWVTLTVDVNEIKGVHDVYLKCIGGSGYLFNINWWKFIASEEIPKVVRAVTSVKLDDVELTLGKGDKKTLLARVIPASATNTKVTWESSDVNIASVDKYGVVLVVGEGTATITATTVDGGYTATCLIKVTGQDVDSSSVADNGGDDVTDVLNQEKMSKKTNVGIYIIVILGLVVLITAVVFVVFRKKILSKKDTI